MKLYKQRIIGLLIVILSIISMWLFHLLGESDVTASVLFLIIGVAAIFTKNDLSTTE